MVAGMKINTGSHKGSKAASKESSRIQSKANSKANSRASSSQGTRRKSNFVPIIEEDPVKGAPKIPLRGITGESIFVSEDLDAKSEDLTVNEHLLELEHTANEPDSTNVNDLTTVRESNKENNN